MQARPYTWRAGAASPSIKTPFHIWAGWMMDLGFLERMRLSPPTALTQAKRRHWNRTQAKLMLAQLLMRQLILQEQTPLTNAPLTQAPQKQTT